MDQKQAVLTINGKLRTLLYDERLLLADSVEKVGHGFHGREVCT